MTTKSTKIVRSEQLTKKLVIGAAVGAVVGLALGYVWAIGEEQGRLPVGHRQSGVARQPIKPNEILKLGVSLLAVARQFSDLVHKA